MVSSDLFSIEQQRPVIEITPALVERLKRLKPLARLLRKKGPAIDAMSFGQLNALAHYDEISEELGRNWDALARLGEIAGFNRDDMARLVMLNVDLHHSMFPRSKGPGLFDYAELI
jgi:hypothetical protein